MPNASNGTSPCAACKLLRRRCAPECVFAPHFPAEQPHKFAIVHRVFGASNINKMLQDLAAEQRADAVSSLVYEAEARFRDPVYGCAGAIASLQQQVAQLQVQLALAQAETVYARMQQAPTVTNASHLSVGSNKAPALPVGVGVGMLGLDHVGLQRANVAAPDLDLALDCVSPTPFPIACKKEKPTMGYRELPAPARDYGPYAPATVTAASTADIMCLPDHASSGSRDHSKDSVMLHPISLSVVRNNFMLPNDASPFSVDSVMELGDMDMDASINSINQMSPPTPPGSPDLLSPFSKPMFQTTFALGASLW